MPSGRALGAPAPNDIGGTENVKRFGKKAVAGLAALVAASALALTGQSSAEGTETLGAPSIAIASGTGVVSDGTGLEAQPSSVSLDVPAGATVKQVLAYWEGSHYEGDAPDDTLTIGAQEVTGTLIGGPTFFFPDFDINPARQVFASAFRADITSLGLVSAGANSLSLSGLNFSYRNDGAGIAVIYDDGTAPAHIAVRDGVDVAWQGFPAERQVTVPQTFTFPAAAAARAAELTVMVASVSNGGRGNSIDVTVAGTTTTIPNALNANDGEEWDNLTIPVIIPAGETSVTVGIRSSGTDPASLVWVAGVLAVKALPVVPPCTTSSTAAVTHGSAYGADVTLLGLHPIDKAAGVATVAPGAPANAAKQVATASVLGLANLGILTGSSNSSLNPSTSTAAGTVANVNLLGGLVTATAVRGVSQSVASTTGSSYGSAGSAIVGLRVSGNPVTVAPNTSVAVKMNLGLVKVTVAELAIYEESGSSSFAAGVSSASHSVNMLRLTVVSSLVGLPVGTQIILGHAQSDATSPISTCAGPASRVSGEAYTAGVNGLLAGQQFANLKVGSAVLPVSGGANSDRNVVSLPGVAQTATATNTTSGSVTPTPSATSRSITQGANVLGGLVTADTLDVKATSAANGTTAGTTLTMTFVNLRVAGTTITGTVAPNTVIVVSLGGGNLLSVTLNEQTTATTGGTDTEGTINAVHARLFLAGGLLAGDVVVASAHSDAHV